MLIATWVWAGMEYGGRGDLLKQKSSLMPEARRVS